MDNLDLLDIMDTKILKITNSVKPKPLTLFNSKVDSMDFVELLNKRNISISIIIIIIIIIITIIIIIIIIII